MRKDVKKIKGQLPLSLYVHIPFCERKCPYCDFYSIEDKSAIARYLSALMTQIREYGKLSSAYKVNTIFFGGGTPSLLEHKDFKELFDTIKKSFTVSDTAEISAEVNPQSASLKKLRKLRRMGINRISIGVQSFLDEELLALGRLHSAREAIETVKAARQAKIKNIGIDLMYGLPQQSMNAFVENVDIALSQDVDHISAYGLKVEEGTPFYAARDSLNLPTEELWVDMYEELCARLTDKGFLQYEVSNFAKVGHECKHNITYWELGEYLGLGAGAHSFFSNKRFSFCADIEEYCDFMEGKTTKKITRDYLEVTASERYYDYIMLGMRMAKGIDTEEFARKFNKDFETFLGQNLSKYVEHGFIEHKINNYKFTTKGFCMSNYILADLLP